VGRFLRHGVVINILSSSLTTMLIVDKHYMTSAVTNFRCKKLIAQVNK